MCKNEYDAHKAMKQHHLVAGYTEKPGYRLRQVRIYNTLRKFFVPNMMAWNLAGKLA